MMGFSNLPVSLERTCALIELEVSRWALGVPLPMTDLIAFPAFCRFLLLVDPVFLRLFVLERDRRNRGWETGVARLVLWSARRWKIVSRVSWNHVWL